MRPRRRPRSPRRRVSRSANSCSSPRAAIFTASPRAARRCRSGRERRKATSMMTAIGWWNAPTRFLPSGRSTPVLPPIDESIWATSVVGTWINGTPRSQVAARKPAASPSAPPPIATNGSSRSGPDAGQLARRVLDNPEALRGLALRQHDLLDRPAVGREAFGDRCPRGRPGTRLGDEDRAPGLGVTERGAYLRGRDPLAEDDVRRSPCRPGGGRRRRWSRGSEPGPVAPQRARRPDRRASPPPTRC